MGRNLLAGVKELLEMRPEGGAFEQAENTEGLGQQPSAGGGCWWGLGPSLGAYHLGDLGI